MAKPADKPAPVLDKEALFKEHKVPVLLKPVFGSFIDWLNSFDANHDGVPEISKWAPIIFKVSPLLLELAKHIDWVKLFSFFAKDKTHTDKIVEEIKSIAKVVEPVLEAEVKVVEGGA